MNVLQMNNRKSCEIGDRNPRQTLADGPSTNFDFMRERRFVLSFFLASFATLAVIPSAHSAEHSVLDSPPNIVLLFIDDWAWNGSPVPMDNAMENSRMPVLQMPNVERLAREGMKFRNAYASPQCSPSRVCVQTGT
tara:strand:- start:231498 stop:231905 length:408 start_codon:yes stop_codon:yes gene_type:complete